jgi:SNF2 family DNA or RNA helicase
MAKNETSRLHSTLLHIDAQMRLGMTGTPIENYLRELKALFDITLPNYMPGPTLFKDLFVIPIEKEHDPKATAFLQKLIDPFVLRRKKEEVLQDLPPKTEEVYHCELLPEQQQLYTEVLQRSREQLLSGLKDNASPIPYMHIFAILSALKQICDHPAVYLKHPENYRQHRSGKWDLFLELLQEARDSKQKVVVYSQYLGMLDIIESYLKESNIGYAAIRGATANRGEQIKRFNTDPNCEIFVGSLQASGLGIDLTAASVVIHYDRWWNAARENQATDRVHRIGQQRGVQVFKLVTKNTFEERIDQLILSKAKLMESVVTTDDQHLIKYLSRDELINLLRYD